MQNDVICVCGAGTMGRGIAQATALAGFPTVLYELNNAVLVQAQEMVHGDLKKLVAKQKLSAKEAGAVFRSIQFTSDLDHCKAAIIIEAVVEKAPVKIELFNQLAARNAPDTILTSNTSSLSITSLAAQVSGPARVAGLHFFNPAPVMKLVEVVRGEQTSDSVVEKLVAFARQLGKIPVMCRDAPGFIVNRVARPFYIEALRLAEEGKSDVETTDRLLEAAGFKLGPFRLMDLIGNDVNYAVSCSVYEQLGKPARLAPSYLQQEKVAAGNFGKKTGRGYYQYPQDAK